MKRYLLPALVTANALLLVAGWAMAVVAYPRLPSQILLWINLIGQPLLWVKKTPVFFLYPGAQVLLSFLFSLVALVPRISPQIKDERQRQVIQNLRKEEAWTALIFFHLILIHLQRSLIFLSHGLKEGIQPTYFMLLLVFLFLLIPAYRLRIRLSLASLA